VAEQPLSGVTPAGIETSFPLEGPRSLYGASKLASELLLVEYGAMFGLGFVINRLGVISGPGQMGKEEQGVFAYWIGRHLFGGDLAYRGWGGRGKQVRDVLHVDDVWELIKRQLGKWDVVNGRTYNAGGGPDGTLSLAETTAVAQSLTGRRLHIRAEPETDPLDVRVYVTNNAVITADTGWRPQRSPETVLHDIHEWMRANTSQVGKIFAA
jgi:CDP-paratose 2-epimerase